MSAGEEYSSDYKTRVFMDLSRKTCSQLRRAPTKPQHACSSPPTVIASPCKYGHFIRTHKAL